jgi:hypothetical protein
MGTDPGAPAGVPRGAPALRVRGSPDHGAGRAPQDGVAQRRAAGSWTRRARRALRRGRPAPSPVRRARRRRLDASLHASAAPPPPGRGPPGRAPARRGSARPRAEPERPGAPARRPVRRDAAAPVRRLRRRSRACRSRAHAPPAGAEPTTLAPSFARHAPRPRGPSRSTADLRRRAAVTRLPAAVDVRAPLRLLAGGRGRGAVRRPSGWGPMTRMRRTSAGGGHRDRGDARVAVGSWAGRSFSSRTVPRGRRSARASRRRSGRPAPSRPGGGRRRRAPRGVAAPASRPGRSFSASAGLPVQAVEPGPPRAPQARSNARRRRAGSRHSAAASRSTAASIAAVRVLNRPWLCISPNIRIGLSPLRPVER